MDDEPSSKNKLQIANLKSQMSWVDRRDLNSHSSHSQCDALPVKLQSTKNNRTTKVSWHLKPEGFWAKSARRANCRNWTGDLWFFTSTLYDVVNLSIRPKMKWLGDKFWNWCLSFLQNVINSGIRPKVLAETTGLEPAREILDCLANSYGYRFITFPK